MKLMIIASAALVPMVCSDLAIDGATSSLELSVPWEATSREIPRLEDHAELAALLKFLPPASAALPTPSAPPTHTSSRPFPGQPYKCSALTTNGTSKCSVDAGEPNGSTCSTGGGTNNVCSAEGVQDGGLFCSVDSHPFGLCSVVHKDGQQNYCSAQGDATTRCSVDMFGFCSITRKAPNQPGFENKCTAFTSQEDAMNGAKCSAFNPNPTSSDAFCSIRADERNPATNAICTTLQVSADDPATGPQCSAFSPGGEPHEGGQKICSAMINGHFYPPESWPDGICRSVVPE